MRSSGEWPKYKPGSTILHSVGVSKVHPFFLSIAILCGTAAGAIAEEPDSWAVGGKPNAVPEDRVERWCEIQGTKVRYANFPIPG